MKEHHFPISPKPTCQGLLTSSPTTKAPLPVPIKTDAPSQTRRQRRKESESRPSTAQSPQPLSHPSLQNSSDPIATRTARAETQDPATQHHAAILQLTVARAKRYIDKIPPAVSGEGGHAQTFSAAVTLLHGFALPTDEAWPILADYNARCVPPWTPEELRHKLQSATRLTHHSRPRGHLVETTSGPHIILRTPAARATKPLKPAGRVRMPEIPPPAEPTPPVEPTPPPIPSTGSIPSTSPLNKVGTFSSEPSAPPTPETAQPTPPAKPAPTTKPSPLERALATAQRYNMNIPEKCCPICWVHWGRSLWIGSCICTGSIKGWEGVRLE